MDKAKNDRRIRKTRSLIRRTFTQLLMKKDLKDITVSELTELADINRGTFYLHYMDMYDLFEQVEKEIIDNFVQIVGKYRNNTQSLLLPVLLETSKYIEANSEIFIAILRTKETTFLDQIIEICRPQNLMEWQILFPGGKEDYYEYYYSFIASGCISLLLRWFDNGMKESPEHMAALAEKMIGNCINNL